MKRDLKCRRLKEELGLEKLNRGGSGWRKGERRFGLGKRLEKEGRYGGEWKMSWNESFHSMLQDFTFQ